MSQIVIVGAGNVAWHLAPALETEGASIVGVLSRSKSSAKALAKRLYDTQVLLSYDLRNVPADIVLLCTPDEAIAEVGQRLQLPEHTILAHISGATPLSQLQAVTANPTGVFYPLQTFSKQKEVSFGQVPICIEGSDPTTLDTLADLAWLISEQVYHFSSEERLALHTAAVVSCNFVNHLWALTYDFLKDTPIPFPLLKPLIQETFGKAFEYEPKTVQTGPALRHDETTLRAHQAVLAAHPKLQTLYRLLSESIQEYHIK